MPRTNTHNRYHAVVLVALLALIASQFSAWASPATASRVASPAASPAATPVGNGCDTLEPYFRQMADLIVPNEGLAMLKTVKNDVLALTDTQAKTIISSLDDLIRRTQAVTPPPAALAYHLAYINLISWYRDLATSRDPASHQRLIDGDKRIVPAIARGVHLGQATCGADVWNAARDAAFPSKP